MPRIALTSVDQHARAIGVRGTQLLLDRIARPGGEVRHESLAPALVVRGSTARSTTGENPVGR